ncbi:Uncharacterised protein [Klebsiella pneumoniae]|nr:Uncharacterised protein [Klebsiella pneumoniae]VGD27656.1 Uncharacterised protein [Klebsiella pneumoniae]
MSHIKQTELDLPAAGSKGIEYTQGVVLPQVR